MSTFLEIIGSLLGFFVLGAVFGSGDTFAGWVFERLRARREDVPETDATVYLVLGDGTRIPADEIPRTRDGSVDPLWLDKNCKCGNSHAPAPVGGYL